MREKLYDYIKTIELDYLEELEVDNDLIIFQTIMSQNDKFLSINNSNLFLLSSFGLEIEIKSGSYFVRRNNSLCFKNLQENDMILLINGMVPYNYFVSDSISPNNIDILSLRVSNNKCILIEDKARDISFSQRETNIITKPIIVNEEEYLYVNTNVFGSLFNDSIANELKKYSNIIIDLRNHTGGSFKQMLSSLKYFIFKENLIFNIRRKDNEIIQYSVDTEATQLLNRILVLIGNNTISSAEIFAGFLRQHSNTILIGTKSYGKNIIHKNVVLDNGYNINVPKYEVMLDNKIFDHGLNPDVVLNDIDSDEYDSISIITRIEEEISNIDLFFQPI